MTGSLLASYIGKTITLFDKRTGTSYRKTITNTRQMWGRLQITVEGQGDLWFEPTSEEGGTASFAGSMMRGLDSKVTHHASVFKPADLNDDLLRVVREAHRAMIISTEQVFALGLTQHDQEDWENGDDVVEFIEGVNDKPNHHIESVRKAIWDYREAQHEAKAERAADVNEVGDSQDLKYTLPFPSPA